MARLLLGVSGGIAAYKALETARLAVRGGHSVRVIQTAASESFVGRASFAAITGAPVLADEFEPDPARGAYPGEPVPDRAPISHLSLVELADAFLIAPASANTLAKLAAGQADNLLTTAALAAACPVLVAPAMNDRMYRHPATQRNLQTLTARHVIVIPPGEGELASHGESGVGRLPEPPELLAAWEHAASPLGSWSGLRALVTAGGTQEPIDSVRFIGNRSSGRMGYALAERAAARGATVVVVAANVRLPDPAGVQVVPVRTAAEMQLACEAHAPGSDVALMAAAVADFRPASPAPDKLKKDEGVPILELEPTEDILTQIAARRRAGQILVGFAAEHGEQAIVYGRSKLERKGLDLIVINDIARGDIGFDASHNEVTLLGRDGLERTIPRADKTQVAEDILNEVERLRATTGGESHGAGRAASVGTTSV
ncbi:MAG TPA: bifunctional phosphopantothenoylcysteine decarboxylase/phosphopantothenate--cysteine ligase CoaBC [Solirubrobacteraceae bacterium]|nr:bifunctional phosphopantothenoylcysteine decarboxylase/phosphopantothenate--cysteine ligase CoaBC [Solirubrobacteraceae bacterium]